MTTAEFRRMALSFPESSEGSHMDHPDFRVRGKIFATLHYPNRSWGMVKLLPAQQKRFVRTNPEAFQPVAGAWGRRGCTHVRLKAVKNTKLREALSLAWTNAAPEELVRK